MNIQGIAPAISAPTQTPAPRATPSTGTNGATGNSNSSAGSASSLQDTFLNLLVTELQNQDPTAPVDPTEMVTQMVSLNSLDQLISINSTLQNMSGSASTESTPSSDSRASQTAVAFGNAAATSAPNPAAFTVLNPLAAATSSGDTGGPMNLYGGVSTPAMNSTSRTQGAN